MIVTVRGEGKNSARVITIPVVLARTLNIRPGDQLEIVEVGNVLVLTKVKS